MSRHARVAAYRLLRRQLLVILSEAKNLSVLLPLRTRERFFSSLRMTKFDGFESTHLLLVGTVSLGYCVVRSETSRLNTEFTENGHRGAQRKKRAALGAALLDSSATEKFASITADPPFCGRRLPEVAHRTGAPQALSPRARSPAWELQSLCRLSL